MAIITIPAGNKFVTGQTVTSTNLNNLVDTAFFGADAAYNGTLSVDATSGKLRVGVINSENISVGAVTSSNILDGTIVNADVSPTAAIAGTKISSSFGTQDIGATGDLWLGGTISDYTKVTLQNTSGVSTQFYADSNTNSGLATTTNHPLSFSTNNVERVRIGASGNVGIGKTSPSTILDVNGTVTATAFSGPLTGNVTGSSGSCTGNALTSSSCSGNSATATLATNSLTISNGGGQGGTPMKFHYSGQGGQPNWVWGSNDAGGGNNNYVWNPANFYVAYATNAGYAISTSSADYATRAALGPVNGTFWQDHTSGASKIYVGGFGVNKGHGIHFKRAAAEAASALHFERENGVVSGSIVQNASGGIAYNSASDYRLKEDLIPVSDGLLKVNSLKPTNFKWIDIDSRIDGFIAHEVKDVIPNAVTGEKDDVDENNDPIYQQIDQSKLIPIMVAAIQELSKKVAELESR